MKAAIELVRPAVTKADAKKAKPKPVAPSPAQPPSGPSSQPDREGTATLPGPAAVSGGKSKLPLFAGLAARVIALIALTAFFLVPKRQPANVPAPGSSASPPHPAETGASQRSASPSGSLATRESAPRFSPSSEPWQDLLANPSKLKLWGATLTPEGLVMSGAKGADTVERCFDGAIRMIDTVDAGRGKVLWARKFASDDSVVAYAKPPSEIRLEKHVPGGNKELLSAFPIMAPRMPGNVLYQFGQGGNETIFWKREDAGTFTPPSNLHLTRSATPPKAGDDIELELRAVGTKLTAKVNGQIVAEATDVTLTHGAFGLSNGKGDPIQLKSVEVLSPGQRTRDGTTSHPCHPCHACPRAGCGAEPHGEVARGAGAAVAGGVCEGGHRSV